MGMRHNFEFLRVNAFFVFCTGVIHVREAESRRTYTFINIKLTNLM